MRHVLGYSFLLLTTSVLAGNATSNVAIKTALTKINSDVDAVIVSNPLQAISFDNFASRSYLYFYRAEAYVRMAQQGRERLRNLKLALADLRSAKTSTNFDMERVNELSTRVLKEIIDALVLAGNHAAVINMIDQLPTKDKSDPRYVLFYGQALFGNAQMDDFKRLARNYHKLFTDSAQVARYLPKPPAWESVLETITVPEPAPKTIAKKSSEPMTKELLLSDPANALLRLRKNSYFSDAEATFKTASNLYFSVKKKTELSSEEKKFVRTFRRHMYFFAPAFMDNLIFSHWKQADLKTAELLSTSFLAQFEGHSLYPKVLFNLGRIQEDAQNYSRAAKSFKNFMEKSDDPTYLELARFRMPWVLMLDKQMEKAQPYFEAYLKEHPEGKYASTCEYFLLKIKSETARDDDQQQAVHAFIKKYPLNLYAYVLLDEYKLPDELIRQTLASNNPLKDQAHVIREFKGDVKTLGQLALYRELFAFNLKDDAIKVLRNFSAQANNELFALYLASQFQELEDTNGEVNNLIKAVAKVNAFGSLIPWKGLYPDFRLDAITQEIAAQNSLLSPLLVIALIRQESAFNPSALSSAKAQGLMQLIPKTAQGAAKKLNLQEFSLLNEADNLKLGIHVFDSLLKKYKHRLDYALAAYNAGETAVDLWITLRGHLAPLEFIESIPYPETRVYVKGILRNHAIYRMLYEQSGAPLVSFNF